MLCAKCLSQIDAGSERCVHCQREPLLFERYRLDRPFPASTSSSGMRSYRITQVEDAMLFRACCVELPPSAPLECGETSARRLLELDHRDLATLVEAKFDAQARRSWLIYEHVSGTDLASLIAENDPRLSQPRWLATLLASLATLLKALHDHELVGAELEPHLIGLRGRNSARAKAGPPRLALLELRVPALYEANARVPADDVRELGLLFVRMLAAGGDSSHAAAAELARSGQWRELEGLDSGLQLLLEQMLSSDPQLHIDSTKLRDDALRLSASLRETRREPTPLRIVRNAPLPASITASKPPAGAMPLSRESVRAHRPTDDIPLMRPDELSRELSQAQEAMSKTELPPSPVAVHNNVAWVLIVAVACIVGLAVVATVLLLR